MSKRQGLFEEWTEEGRLVLLQGWARDGLTDKQIAENMGIGLSTLGAWKAKNQDIREALKKGKDYADRQVENALYKSALAGNVTAQIFWLKNRRPGQWRDGKALELAGNVATEPGVLNVFFGGEPDEDIINPYYLAKKRWKEQGDGRTDADFERWRADNGAAYESLLSRCGDEIKQRGA